ncbi:hypothetical protein RchiOBHm_Chr3g0488821 [Rosa chinensis]|uniref:Uncharacterized protein n=1 Tax=Rosa chinensis TaxID=74649 RepID=A0A2P6RFU9_ROSCH|nr:hypothetical protein RchiOBHm_Chr3g0488821 [Rosa chinensis]
MLLVIARLPFAYSLNRACHSIPIVVCIRLLFHLQHHQTPIQSSASEIFAIIVYSLHQTSIRSLASVLFF